MSALNREPLIKPLCQEIAAEENPGKMKHLASDLRDAIENERDETRLRLRLIVRQYREKVASVPHKAGLVDVLSFLGLTSARQK
ncbi:MAG TPA: hypothetical protein VI386_24375 [Candidatus Sulfotelmatobacter sp.]